MAKDAKKKDSRAKAAPKEPSGPVRPTPEGDEKKKGKNRI